MGCVCQGKKACGIAEERKTPTLFYFCALGSPHHHMLFSFYPLHNAWGTVSQRYSTESLVTGSDFHEVLLMYCPAKHNGIKVKKYIYFFASLKTFGNMSEVPVFRIITLAVGFTVILSLG